MAQTWITKLLLVLRRILPFSIVEQHQEGEFDDPSARIVVENANGIKIRAKTVHVLGGVSRSWITAETIIVDGDVDLSELHGYSIMIKGKMRLSGLVAIDTATVKGRITVSDFMIGVFRCSRSVDCSYINAEVIHAASRLSGCLIYTDLLNCEELDSSRVHAFKVKVSDDCWSNGIQAYGVDVGGEFARSGVKTKTLTVTGKVNTSSFNGRHLDVLGSMSSTQVNSRSAKVQQGVKYSDLNLRFELDAPTIESSAVNGAAKQEDRTQAQDKGLKEVMAEAIATREANFQGRRDLLLKK